MPPSSPRIPNQVLTAHDGLHLLYGWQAILKGLLESDREVSLVTGPNGELFDPLWQSANDEGTASTFRAHGLSLTATPTAQRALVLAGRAAQSGHGAVALVANDHLDESLRALHELTRRSLPSGAALVILLEDDPTSETPLLPRRTASQIGLACLEPRNLSDLREQLDHALRLSRATARPIGMVIHRSLLHSAQTMRCYPNREQAPVDALLVRSRRPRISETRDLLRMARRLELNATRSLPSPGERVPIGCITIGPATGVLNHLTHDLNLIGRIPILMLRLLHPLDEAAISRFLQRCRRVIVLEPRPGEVEEAIQHLVASAREHGQPGASLWGRLIPEDSEEGVRSLMPDHGPLHPSVLARELLHLLHMIRPTIDVAGRLAPNPPPLLHPPAPRGALFGASAALDELRKLATEVDQWLHEPSPYEERDVPPTSLAIDGIVPAHYQPRLVFVEFWTALEMIRSGLAAIRHAARTEAPWVFLVADFASPDRISLERMIRGAVPSDHTDRIHIAIASLSQRTDLRELLQNAALEDRLTVLLVRDGSPPRWDPDGLDRALAEIDRFGFQPNQILTWPVEQACAFDLRPNQLTVDPDESRQPPTPVRTEVSVERTSRHSRGPLRLRVQPMVEQIEVVRTRPPAWQWHSPDSPRPQIPSPVHRAQSHWRAHLAGFRGRIPGLAGMVLTDAGREMGYDVQCVGDPTVIGPGRRAWMQLLYRRISETERTAPHFTPTIPYGEADLLLVLDGAEGLRAVDPDAPLRVASPQQTATVANVGHFSGESETAPTAGEQANIVQSLAAVTHADRQSLHNYSAACRLWFQTDRVTDLALLGAAYQHGFIPVTLEAIERAVRRVEERGYGRAQEAFAFGRQLAIEERLLARRREESDPDLDHLARRLVLPLKRSRWRGASIASELDSLIRKSLQAMPGLMETNSGRDAMRIFLMAAYRCMEWGGMRYAERYVELITTLYRADRANAGRALTRHAILPLAETMLIHDPIYLATMATSPEQRRRLRERVNVKPGRGDQIERRYLTRLELTAFRRRFRADVRTSDWPARIARGLWHLTPSPWRGTRRERELREYTMELVRRAGYESEQRYEHWRDVFRRLHHHAVENRLRDMAIAELRMLSNHEVSFRVQDDSPSEGAVQRVEPAADPAARPTETSR